MTTTTNIKLTTPGAWIVGSYIRNDEHHIAALSAKDVDKAIALCGLRNAADENESLANAALIACAPDMLDALIAIQETMMTKPAAQFNEADMTAIAEMISDVFAKLANEAGEEL